MRKANEMIAIIESGSTKADWVLINGDEQTHLSTQGINPLFLSSKAITSLLSNNRELAEVKDHIQTIHFYGAGCSSEEKNKTVQTGLSAIFPNATITIESDLMACVKAVYDGKDTIACILGTGSNSCLFDGKSIHQERPSIGYILGDEGSGTYFGKQLLRDFLYGNLPDEIAQPLTAKGLDKETIVANVYGPGSNVYLASFMPILVEFKSTDYAKQVIKDGLTAFVDIHIKAYNNYRDTDVSFVGSIAKVLEQELTEVCASNGIRLKHVIQRPLDRLTNYHLND